jgi:hypothetical protein
MVKWQSVLELDAKQQATKGSTKALCKAIGNGADLRIHTDFRHNEHIDTSSDNEDMVNEISEFHETCLLDDRWAAGFMTTRQPVSLPGNFGPPSMSFFMYNQDGKQAIARPYLSKRPAETNSFDTKMKKYHEFNKWDGDTNAPSSNFVYDFDLIRYIVRDDWQQVLAHNPDGQVEFGSIDDLWKAFMDGCEVKVGIRGLFDDLKDNDSKINHEVFIQIGWAYFYSEQKLMVSATHPLVRVSPAIPLVYKSKGWDFGWFIVRSDGYVSKRICDPQTLTFKDSKDNKAIRWFVR